MVELRRDVDFEGPVITGFTLNGFKVGEQRFESGLLISPHQALSWDAPAIDMLGFEAVLTALDLDPKPEFLLFGSGDIMRQPPGAFRRAAAAYGIGIETMDSKAAARIWGVLRSEERWIIGALMPLGQAIS